MPDSSPSPSSPVSPAPAAAHGAVSGRRTRVALVGSGYIAGVHLQVLRAVPHVRVVALCDAHHDRARRLAKKHRIAATFGSLDELLAANVADAVHVLVPPRAHAQVAAACLRAGLHVLVEKPFALDAADIATLQQLARETQRVLAVNHNQVFHPAVRALQGHVAAGRLGPLEHVAVQHHVPLRQLQSGDVGHFMFETEANILWEQAVHPFSLLFALLGPCKRVHAVTGARRQLANGVSFVDDWLLQLQHERGTATVRMAFGKAWQETTVQAIGCDGGALLDLTRASCWLRRKTRWLDFFDHARNLASGASHLAGRAVASVVGYSLALFRLGFPDDPFLRSMRGSLRGFHAAVRGAELPETVSPVAARAVQQMCELAAEAAGASRTAPPPPAAPPPPGAARTGEVVVLGGTGFLGRRCVALLRAADTPVTLIVRRPQLLPPDLCTGSVRVFAGDAADPDVLANAFAGATAVLHLATAMGDDPDAVEQSMASAARVAGAAALAANVHRFVYTSSSAALWLGGEVTVAGDAATDPRPRARAPYARGKIAAERELGALRAKGLPLVIVRPAIVVGEGGIAEHSGVGSWVRDNHCVGWGPGSTPLPLVLADDCAQALVEALSAQAATGHAYNLAGDVRLTAREYVEAMATRTGRDYRFHPTRLWRMWLVEALKYCIKTLALRPRQWVTYHDLASRSFRTVLDCTDSKRDLGFSPETDRARFLARVFDRRTR